MVLPINIQIEKITSDIAVPWRYLFIYIGNVKTGPK